MAGFVDHYAVLGVSSRAEREEIEAAYIKSIEIDPNTSLDSAALKRLEDLKISRNLLVNPVDRSIYDIDHRNYHFMLAVRAIRSGLDDAVRDAERIANQKP